MLECPNTDTWNSNYYRLFTSLLSITLYKAIYPVRSMQLSLMLRSMQVALKSEKKNVIEKIDEVWQSSAS